MATYKLYILDRYGHICERRDLKAADDGEAGRIAETVPADHGVELWEADRKILSHGAKHVPLT